MSNQKIYPTLIHQLKSLSNKKITKTNCQQVMNLIVKISLDDDTFRLSKVLGGLNIIRCNIVGHMLKAYYRDALELNKKKIAQAVQDDFNKFKQSHDTWLVWKCGDVSYHLSEMPYHHVQKLTPKYTKLVLNVMLKSIQDK